MRIVGFILCLFFAIAHGAELKTIQMNQQANKTSYYLTIQGTFTHRLFFLTNPNRIVLDLKNTQMPVQLNSHLTNTLVRGLRKGQLDAKTLRLVFDVSQKVQVTSLPWRVQNSLKGIQLDVKPMGGAPTLPLKTAVLKNKPLPPQQTLNKNLAKESTHSTNAYLLPKPSAQGAKLPSLIQNATIPNKPLASNQAILIHQTPIHVPHVPSLSLRDVVVVLDAGHGGKNPGAKGPRRSREKDVTLAITLKLKQLIDKQVGMHAVLTRSGDYYLGLRNRLDIARKYNGDVFVSIHADAFKNPHSNGASVFALSQSGATSEAARWLAEKENYSELGGVNLGDLDDQNGIVRSVLIDLSQTATINSGLQMGKGVLNQMQVFTRLHNYKVEQARFMVLKSPDIPSILVETGFISNPQEEKNLTSPAYQTRLSQAIFQGIKGYFWESPPHGSRIEAMTNHVRRYHVARSGETLSSIARAHHVSLASLQAINHLWSNAKPKPGQKLVIPSAWS